MALPLPLPDDPRKWDGWSRYHSENFYERLCLSFDPRPSDELIEEHSRHLLVWWQKKLPLKHQPSNPIAQMLRMGLDTAPHHIAEARAELLNPARRLEIDAALTEGRRHRALSEFQKYLDFALAEKVLAREAEANLFKVGRTLGLSGADVTASVNGALVSAGAAREAEIAPPVPAGSHSTRERPAAPVRSARLTAARDQLSTDEERCRFPEFSNGIGTRMLLIPSGRFSMGRQTPEAPIDEQPAIQVAMRRFYMACHPVTNAQYEAFDPAHAAWRSPGAGDNHPVVYVSHLDAIRFCEWLSRRENKPYRLPTEAEWEYAARGTDGRIHPWANTQKLSLAKFTLSAATDTHGPSWRETVGDGKAAANLEGGAAGASPVGSCPLGASPFGIEDLVGNVWEWCADYYGPYQAAERVSPRGPDSGTERVCRGGSWRSPSVILKATTRGFHLPTHASNDVGLRVVCDCIRAADASRNDAQRIERIERRLDVWIADQQTALNGLAARQPGFFTSRKARAAWSMVMAAVQGRLQSLNDRRSRLRSRCGSELAIDTP